MSKELKEDKKVVAFVGQGIMGKRVLVDALIDKPTTSDKDIEEALEYFKNRNSFEIPVYDTPQFNTIKQALQNNKIKIYQQDNLIKKYHNVDFPLYRDEIEKLEEDVKELQDYYNKNTDYQVKYEEAQQRIKELEEMVYCMRELLGFVPKDIQDVATFTWKELNEIFNKRGVR